MTETELRAAVETYRESIRAARDERDSAIRRAHAAGWRQVDIIRATGYSRETVRVILKGTD